MADDATPEEMAFALFNEIAIIDQLARTVFEARLPRGFVVAQFAVAEPSCPRRRRAHAAGAGASVSGAEDDHDAYSRHA